MPGAPSRRSGRIVPGPPYYRPLEVPPLRRALIEMPPALTPDRAKDRRVTPAALVALRSFYTTFTTTENPLSYSGAFSKLTTNRTVVRATSNIARGTQVGGGFDDSYAGLTGAWSPDIEITTRIHKSSPGDIREVEHLHRITDGASIMTCYELFIPYDGGYCNIVQWNNGVTLPDYRYVVPDGTYSVPGGVSHNDLFRTRVVGNSMSAWINHGSGWVSIFSNVSDSGTPLTSGRPGIGFFCTEPADDSFGIQDLHVTEV